MKTQTPRKGSAWKAMGMLALSISALLVLSGCHHGTYGQRYAHPHIATYHLHSPDAYGPARKPGQTWHRQIKPGKRYPAHHHTTSGDLQREPNVRNRISL